MKNDELVSVPLPSPEGGATPEFAKLAMVQTLAFKLIAAFIAVSLVGAAIGAIGVFGISRIQRLNQQMYSVDLLGLAAVKDANLALVAATTASADFLLSTTASLDQRQKQRETFEARVADVKRLSIIFRSSFDDEEGKALVARFDSSVAQWHEANQKFFEMVTGAAIGNVDEANESLRAAGNRVNEAMASLSRHKAERADLAARKSEETFVTTRNTVIGASLLGTALCCLVGFAVAKRITRPIAALAATSEKISSGDLNQQVEIDRSDEIGILQRNMKGMTESLNGVISQVISSSVHITAATEEIRQGTTDLSNRSEHQAASLSEATSMIQTLDGSVQHHAAEMNQANTQTGQAWQMTQQSGELVGGLVTSMGKMAERARKMADIVSVIDGIAQQTHILALNAAVEAARAGENGRGFSVVAHEVQALAKRSAEQASAVRELINASIEIVGQGTTIAEDARTKMDAAVQSVQRVTSLIEHVAGSAREQSEQLTGALKLLRSLDQATQQNASLAEESAAATSLISEQALSLTRQIQHFRIANA